jgi:hypothetical protein
MTNTTAQQTSPSTASDLIGGYDLSTSAGGRGYVAEFFATRLRRHDFGAYIRERLAADFACAIAGYLHEQDVALEQSTNTKVTVARMGYGAVAVGTCLSEETGEPGIIYLALDEAGEIGRDTTDVYPVGSRVDASRVLAYVSFKTPAAVDQTKSFLDELKATHWPQDAAAQEQKPVAEVFRAIVDEQEHGLIAWHGEALSAGTNLYAAAPQSAATVPLTDKRIAALAATVQRRIDGCCTAANTPNADYFDASTNLIIAARELLAAINTPAADIAKQQSTAEVQS